MLDQEILELRRKLNESVTNEKDYKKTYKLSVELDNMQYSQYPKDGNSPDVH